MKKFALHIALILFTLGLSAQVPRHPFFGGSGPTVFYDDFNSYVNNTILGGQGNWLEEMNDVRAYGGTHAIPATSSVKCAIYFNATFSGDHYAQVDVPDVVGGAGLGPAVRCQGGTQSCYFWWSSTTASYLQRLDGGSTTTFATGTAWTDGDEIRLEVVGQVLSCYRNDALDTSISGDGIYTVTTGTLLTGGYAGMGGHGWATTNETDNWEGGNQ